MSAITLKSGVKDFQLSNNLNLWCQFFHIEAAHEHGTVFVPEFHAVTTAAGFDTTIGLKWELRKRLVARHGNCVESDKQVNTTAK